MHRRYSLSSIHYRFIHRYRSIESMRRRCDSSRFPSSMDGIAQDDTWTHDIIGGATDHAWTHTGKYHFHSLSLRSFLGRQKWSRTATHRSKEGGVVLSPTFSLYVCVCVCVIVPCVALAATQVHHDAQRRQSMMMPMMPMRMQMRIQMVVVLS